MLLFVIQNEKAAFRLALPLAFSRSISNFRGYDTILRANFLSRQKCEKPLRKKENPATSMVTGFLISGGEGGIRTLETLLRPTRFPIVRARPNYATSPRVRSASPGDIQLAAG